MSAELTIKIEDQTPHEAAAQPVAESAAMPPAPAAAQMPVQGPIAPAKAQQAVQAPAPTPATKVQQAAQQLPPASAKVQQATTVTNDVQQQAAEELRRAQFKQQVEQEKRSQSPEYRESREAIEDKRAKAQERQVAAQQRAAAREVEAAKPLEQRAKEKAVEALETAKFKEQVEQEKRARDPLYKAQAELAAAYQETAKELRQSTEAKRIERLAVEKMTVEERIEHLAARESARQIEAKAVKERVAAIMQPQEVAIPRNDWEKLFDAAKEHTGNPFATMISHFEPVAKRLGLVDAPKAAQEIKHPTAPKSATSNDTVTERASPTAVSPTIQKSQEKSVQDFIMHDNAAPQKTPPVTVSAAQAPPNMPPPENPTNEEGFAGAVIDLIPVVGEIFLAAKAVEGISNSVQKMEDIGLGMMRNAVQGGAHQASQGIALSAQAQSATVDWIPIVGPMIGNIISAPTKMLGKAVEGVEEVFITAGKGMREAARGMSEIASFDSKGFASHMGELAEQRIPFFGTVVRATTDSVLQLDKAVEGTAKRLSSYSGQLATQTANQEVAVMMREMSRANRFGSGVAAANESRFRAEQKLADIADRFAPFVMTATEKIFDVIGDGLTNIDNNFKLALRVLDTQLAVSQATNIILLGPTNPVSQQLAGIRALIAQAISDGNTAGEQQLWNNFINMQMGGGLGGFENVAATPANPLPAIQMP